LLTGKIPYFTTPPAREVSEHAESSIVATWGKEFDVEDVFKNEESTVIAGLPSLVDTLHVEMPSTAPLTMDIDIPEVLSNLNLCTPCIPLSAASNFCLVFLSVFIGDVLADEEVSGLKR
jgi:hypothetical protein